MCAFSSLCAFCCVLPSSPSPFTSLFSWSIYHQGVCGLPLPTSLKSCDPSVITVTKPASRSPSSLSRFSCFVVLLPFYLTLFLLISFHRSFVTVVLILNLLSTPVMVYLRFTFKLTAISPSNSSSTTFSSIAFHSFHHIYFRCTSDIPPILVLPSIEIPRPPSFVLFVCFFPSHSASV